MGKNGKTKQREKINCISENNSDDVIAWLYFNKKFEINISGY